MIDAILSKHLLGLKLGWWLLIAVSLTGAYFAYGAVLDRLTQQASETGAVRQQNDNLTETLERTKEANNAAQKLDTDPAARHDGCVRHSRTPSNC